MLIEDVLADTDCPLCDEDRQAAAHEIRLLRKLLAEAVNGKWQIAPLKCSHCGADRAKEDCKSHDRANCAMRGAAYVADLAKQKESNG